MNEKVQLQHCISGCPCTRESDEVFRSDFYLRLVNHVTENIAHEIYYNLQNSSETKVKIDPWWLRTDWTPLTSLDIRAYLDNGAFELCWESWYVGNDSHLELLMLVVLAMQFGARIGEEEKVLLRKMRFQSLELGDKTHLFRKALARYKNGEPYVMVDTPIENQGIIEKITYWIRHDYGVDFLEEQETPKKAERKRFCGRSASSSDDDDDDDGEYL